MPASPVRPFGVKASEAIANIQQKVAVPSERWNDFQGPVHAKAFTVAGATTVDLVRDMHDAVSKAVTEQQTISQFRKAFDEIVKKHGWSYKGTRGWRTSVIYRANMRSAAMAGKWQRIQASAKTHPYLRYVAVHDNRTRPQHLAWDGTTLPINDPWWQVYYPPNGYLCRCDVRACSETDLTRHGWALSDSPEVVYRDVMDAETGEITGTVARGVDPGWDHNVGQSWIDPELALGRKLATMPASMQAQAIDKSITPAYQQIMADNWRNNYQAIVAGGKPKSTTQIVGFFDSEAYAAIAKYDQPQQVAIAVLDQNVVKLGNVKTKPANNVWPSEWLADLPKTIQNYRAILLDPDNEELIIITRDMVDGKVGKAVIKTNQLYGSQLINAVTSLMLEPLDKFKGYEVLWGSL